MCEVAGSTVKNCFHTAFGISRSCPISKVNIKHTRYNKNQS
jgi:hypothetical protein